MDDHEIPHHFICPISLQIMKDPVTVITGITYDRESIQQWQSHAQNNTCPVTNQLLPVDSDFTPNHNLRRLIQSWQVLDQPSKQSSLHMKVIAINLIKNLKVQDLKIESLQSLVNLAYESENNRVLLKEVGVVSAMFTFLVSCHTRNSINSGLKEALNVLFLVRITRNDTHSILAKHDRIISILTWVLDLDACDDLYTTIKYHAIVLLKDVIQHAKPHVLERLNRDFFKTIVLTLQYQKTNNLDHGITEILEIILNTCTWPRNCSMLTDLGVVFELVELELGSPEKEITELVMSVLFHLCSLADGRAQLLGHAGGIAMITKRIGRVSQKVGERAVMIISLISKFSGTHGVVQEMVKVGTVEKLCTVLQVYSLNSYTRDAARDILKRHFNVWSGSSCLDVTLLTRCLD